MGKRRPIPKALAVTLRVGGACWRFFLILLNAHHDPQPFLLPAHRPGVRWEVVLDSRTPDGRRRHRLMKGGEAYDLEGRCLALLRLRARP